MEHQQWRWYNISRKTKITASPSIGLTSTLIIGTNTQRIGGILWNNSSNSVYITLDTTGDSANYMTVIIPAFSAWTIPRDPIYQGPISGKRNAGSGSVVVTEFLPE